MRLARHGPGARFALTCLAVLSSGGCAVAALSSGGCEKDEVTKPNVEVHVNSDAANANARIVSQQSFGVADKQNTIAQLESDDGLSYYFRGYYEGKWAVGVLGAGGSPLWHVRTSYSVGDIAALSHGSPVPGGAVAVGRFDTDGDNLSETGYATLFTPAGVVASEVLFSSDSSDVWLYALAPLSDSEFVAVGGERTASRLNPLVARLVVSGAGTLEKRQTVVLTTIPGRAAWDVATDPADAPGPERRIYLSTEVETGTNLLTLHGVDLSVPGLSPWSVAWSQTLPGKGLGSWEEDMKVSGGDLYVAGVMPDPDKPPASNGGHWSSGLAARLSRDGVVAWSKVVAASGHSDQIVAIEPTASAVALIGSAANYMLTNTKEMFGYGWVARLSPAAGEGLANFTFGDPASCSMFRSGHTLGATMLAGGYTRYETEAGSCLAWLCTLNLGASVSRDAAIAAAPARPGEAAPPGGWRRDRGR